MLKVLYPLESNRHLFHFALRHCGSLLFLFTLSSGCALHFPPVEQDASVGEETRYVCGNGVIEGQEACDDGNIDDDDGCSSSCIVETGWNCQGQPSTCHTFCGDNIQAGDEACDGDDFGTATCESLGYAGGTLGCHQDCSFDASGCAVCGDGRCEHTKGEGIDNCPTDCSVVQLAVGYQSSCALRADGTVWCWGNNDFGQIGHGEVTDYEATPVPVLGITSAIQVDVGGYHACALVDNQTDGTEVWCWGANRHGQLGDVDLAPHYAPIKVVGLDEPVEQVDVGWDFSCARFSGRSIACWGCSTDGRFQCGMDLSEHPDPVVRSWSLDLDQVSCDAGSCCVRFESTKEVSCWGGNRFGELGNGTLDATCVPSVVDSAPAASYLNMGDGYACTIDATGTAWCWGNNDHAQITSSEPLTSIPSAVAVEGTPALERIWLGWNHTCAATQSGEAWCWGANEHGQLGNGQTDDLFHPPAQVHGLDRGVLDAQAAYYYSCALLDSGRVVCWGNSDEGELGNGRTDPSATPVEVLFP